MGDHNNSQEKIALLGATGNTGRVVLRLLLNRGTHHINIYVRSKAKLSALVPGIELNKNVTIFEGAVKDVATMKNCLSGADIIISTLGSNDFEVSTIHRDCVPTILAALRELRSGTPDWQPPRLLYLSSASRNERFAAERPAAVDWLIQKAFQTGYSDLIKGEAMLKEAEPSLVSVLRVQPGCLVEEEGSGLEISTESVRVACSYEDLGRGFVELALHRAYDALNQVGVSSKGGDRLLRYASVILCRLTLAFVTLYVPGGTALCRMFT